LAYAEDDEHTVMAPDIQEDCSATPKPEEEVKPEEDELKCCFNGDVIFAGLLFSIAFYCESRF